ncbi:hypothetical protein PFICI_03574 [Pestalotiopsis fici W106-1]|uniref:Uncharacterized protein n=1 Tax=Pestalotiopsis fici (strain W106-1 / CGMCC3.15140) TaxID=1229662 RepID=W3XHS0_PESFW|nr:uncharacterized protein PFICI_03574 [Pestalotiopsis fici W106-1]ETS85549.1 hypothetical protein PFICI_03574 [Pestalotiopsis fici W106-1]
MDLHGLNVSYKRDTADIAFGPQRDDAFDFTLLFEQSILGILPSALFILLSIARGTSLWHKDTFVRVGWLLWAKLAAAATLICFDVALVVLWALPTTLGTQASLAGSVMNLVGSLAIAALSYTEHRRSIRPSTLLVGYLALTILLDLAQTRTLFLRSPDSGPIQALFTASLATKLAIMCLEELQKRPLVADKTKVFALEETSGPINRSIFWWLNQLFLKGFKGLLQVGDLGGIDNKFDSAELLSKLDGVWQASDKSRNNALIKATCSAFKVAFLAPVIPRLCLAGFSFAQPFLINRVVSFVGESKSDSDQRNAGGIAGGLIGATCLVYLGLAFSRVIYNHLVFQLITILRGSLVSMIFKKTVHLDTTCAKDGAAVTLMSTDVDGIASGIEELHEIWASALELAVAVYLLERQIGPACFLVVIPAVVSGIATNYATDGIGPARGMWNQAVQKRVSITSSMLSQIKGIKMMGLTDYIANLIQGLRANELELSKKFRGFIIRIIMIANFSDQMTPAVVITSAVFWTRSGPNAFTVSAAFTALSIVALVATPMANLMGSIPNFKASVACFDRIQTFLMLEGHEDRRVDTGGGNHSSSSTESDQPSFRAKSSATRVSLEHSSFTLKGQTDPVLQDITASLQRSSCTMLVGPVGCGKSSFLKAILGEIRLSGGTLRVEDIGTSIAYCDQTAWLRNISIRDNIIGQGPFDERWYASVCHACALNVDISQFPLGDKSLVGSGGITLSGGQKQRVAIARALYARRAIVLLDDVFSALDTITSQTVFNRILGRDGLLRKQGATVLLATNAVHQLPFGDNIIVLSSSGRIEQIGSFVDLQAQDGYVKSLALEVRARDANEDAGVSDSDTATDPVPVTAAAEDDNDFARQTGDRSLYKFYLKSTGLPLSVGFLLLAIGYIAMGRMPSIWVRIWTEHGIDQDRGAYFAGYIAYCILTVILSGLIIWFFMFLIIPKSAKHLHWLLLDTVAKAPLWYFTTTDSGIILNRFSQDMTLIDQALPMAFFTTALDSLTLIASAGIIASGAQYVAAMIPLCIAPMYFLQKFYLRTSRQLRHLDLESKSPLYTHFTETLNGVATIRAFGWQQGFQEENLRYLNQSQKPYYLLFCIQRWLNVVMDLFVTGIAIVLVSFAVEFTTTTSSGAIGLAMVTLIGFNTSLSRVISSWTSMETSLGAIARLRDFIRDTPQEGSATESLEPPKSWPSTGAIKINNLTSTYHAENERVLSDVSLQIQPGQKVGICGRTGSGKSSLLLSLLKLLETQSGSIAIDGLDLASVQNNLLRTHLTALPQDSVTLPGSVRTNLDPLETVIGEEVLIDALSRVGMWETISSRGGLEGDFDSLGLSQGQKQLFCLARALISKSPVVLLDEATSSVDHHSDERVQKVLREAFKEKTVLVVAHRLETIGDLDVVVVMEKGRIVEVGDPRELKNKPGSLFGKLWESRHG